MSTLAQMKLNVRILLAHPKANKPSEQDVLYAVVTQVKSLFNRLSNTSKAWAADETQITASSGQRDYLLSVSNNFSKALEVYTVDASNPGHVERYIDFFEIQNIGMDWGQPNDAASAYNSDGSNTTAQRIGFWRKWGGSDTGVYARIQPIPQASAVYNLIYSVNGNWADTAGLQDSPVLSEFHQLVENRAAFSLLPNSEWTDDAKYNAEMRNEVRQTLTANQEMMMPDFEAYITNLHGERVHTRAMY